MGKEEKDLERKKKELLKLLETPEEKRARRLAKKLAKRKQLSGNVDGLEETIGGYSNLNNPFGDTRLMKKFVWEKKMELDKKKYNLSDKQLEILEAERLIKNKAELERVKERRVEREREMFEAEKEKTRQAREREELNMLGWESKEELFHIEQAKIRSRIRFEAGRAKPIDILVKYIETNQKEDDVDDLNLIDTEDLLADIKLYLTFAENIEYWTDLKLLCEHRLEEVKRDALLRDPTKSAQHCRAFDSGLNESVRESVKTILDGKGTGELKALKNSIEKKLAYESDHVDVAYWTELLNHLDVHMAKARLTEFHATILRSKKKFLEAETMEQLPDPIIKEEKNNEIDQPRETIKPMEPETHVVDELEVPLEVEGIYSPPLCPSEDDEVITLEQFVKNLKIQRKAVWEAFCRNSNSIDESSDAQGDAWVERQRSKELEEDEEEFRAEIQLPHQLYFWSDKYRPRKPRYFNRVHTGFEWTKYNRTHYDFDNPPPKVVQGYKFNLFYPDLIDRNKAPSYSVSVDKEEKDFCVIRFSAGPPYEDIAFKIVNREWEFSHKRGFRCRYEKGVFQLWFHFKRDRYRR